VEEEVRRDGDIIQQTKPRSAICKRMMCASCNVHGYPVLQGVTRAFQCAIHNVELAVNYLFIQRKACAPDFHGRKAQRFQFLNV
jgi:hypothetical protein